MIDTVGRDADADGDVVRALFADAYGGSPDVVWSAPARVNLIGEHTDYNGGEVLPVAIARRTWVAARRGSRATVRAVSATQDGAGEFDPQAPARAGRWWDYLAGVAWQLGVAAVEVSGADVAVASNVPPGAGLSSSAALEVATAGALADVAGARLDLRELGLLAQRAEVEFVGVKSGIMDQFAAALARHRHALHVFCDTLDVEHVPMREAVLIFDTAEPRSLRASAYNRRRAECEEALRLLRRHHPELRSLAAAAPDQVRDAVLPAPLDRRALHVSEETRRVSELVAALSRGEPVPGDVLYASHRSLRDNYECSTPALDWFVERVSRADGVRGARLTGAGWGGCAIAVGDAAALGTAAPALAEEFARAFGRRPRTWLTCAERGAGREHASERAG